MVEQSEAHGRSRPFLDLVQRQRAHRRFADQPVDDEVVGRILRAATFAPSAENQQPWVFVVVRDLERRAAIGALMQDVWTSGGRSSTQARTDDRLFRDVDAGIGGGIAAAPVLVVIGGDTELVPRSWLKSSVFPAVQNLLLAALDEGLGCALTTIATLRADDLRVVVGFPPSVEPLAVVPLGWPGRELGPPRRVPFEMKTSRERYGEPWNPTPPTSALGAANSSTVAPRSRQSPDRLVGFEAARLGRRDPEVRSSRGA